MGERFQSLLLQNAAGATGDGTAFGVHAYTSVGFQVYGTFSGTITFEATIDGRDWVSLYAVSMDGLTSAATATAPGIYLASCAGFGLVRARISAFTSGTISVMALANLSGGGSGSGGGGALSEPVEVEGDVGLDAAENHIGEVGGNVGEIIIHPTMAASLHAADDVIGGRQTLTGWARAADKGTKLLSMTVRWLEAPPTAVDYIFFNTAPSTNTADDAGFSWGTSMVDAGTPFMGHIRFESSEFTAVASTTGTVYVCTKSCAAIGMLPDGSADAYLYMKTPNAHTFGTANSQWVTFNPDRD